MYVISEGALRLKSLGFDPGCLKNIILRCARIGKFRILGICTINCQLSRKGKVVTLPSVKYVIVGGGPAALSAAGTIRKHDPDGPVVVISAEKHLPYYRPLISYYLAGEIERKQLSLHETGFYDNFMLRLLYGRAVAIRGENTLLLEVPSGNAVPEKVELRFDRLLIATGAAPVKPDFPGREITGVHFLRTIDDAEAIRKRSQKHRRAVIAGGGLVSLRTACALSKLGLKTTLVVTSAQVLSRMLDPQGAALIARHLEEQGVQVRLNSDISRIDGGAAGVEGVNLTDGTKLEAGLVVIGKGVQPSTVFLEGSALQVAGGIPVNEKLQTNLPHIYAAGDVALYRDLLSGELASHPLWPNAVAQGKIAGANMAGESLTYRGSIGMNATEILGLPVMAAGLVSPGENDPAYEIFDHPYPTEQNGHPQYTRIVLRDNLLVGYVVIGMERKAGILTNLILGGQPLSPYHAEQLKRGTVTYL